MFSFFITKKCSVCKEHRVPRIPNATVCEWCSKIKQLETTIRRLTVKLDRTLEDNRLMERRMQMMRDQAPNSSYAPVKSSSAQVVSTNRRSSRFDSQSSSHSHSDSTYFYPSVVQSDPSPQIFSSVTSGGGGDFRRGGATSSWTASEPSSSDDSCSRSSYGGGSYDSSSSSNSSSNSSSDSSSDSSSSSSSCD